MTLSEVGKEETTPVEMRASLPAGSFSPFDFEKEFQTRHGVRPEDVDKSRRMSYSSKESTISASPLSLEAGATRPGSSPSTIWSRSM